MTVEQMASRFFVKSDKRVDKTLLPLPKVWWSRPYEYAWAEYFADAPRVLDAACGIERPFKFFLLDHAQEVHACDMEDAIISSDALRSGIEKTYGKDIAIGLPEKYLHDINFQKSSITQLPYQDGFFDRIFCISVLEHLPDHFNRYSWLPRVSMLQLLLKKDIMLALSEFKRTLKNDGLIILTFDYPNINLQYFNWLVSCLGLKYAGNFSEDIPDKALYSEYLQLNCYRAVLQKK